MKRMLMLFLCLALLTPAWARAEFQIDLAAGEVTLGSRMEFFLENAPGDSYAYTVLKGGKALFSGDPVPQASGAYLPREQGEYTLRVTAYKNGQKAGEAEARFFVTSFPECTLSASTASAEMGEPVSLTPHVTGGVKPYTYEYTVMAGGECIFRQSTQQETFQYAPGREGSLQIILTVTDSEGNTAQASHPLSVSPGRGISISGSTGAFPAQGGQKSWTIHSPGTWTAETDADFLSLSSACGESGDALTLLMEPGRGKFRKATVTVSSGEWTADFTVVQSAQNGIEEEEALGFSSDLIYVDSQSIAAWHHAQGEKYFSIGATGPWTARTEGDFFSIRTDETGLTVQARKNTRNENRSGMITLSCGSARAYLYVFQFAQNQGADVLDVSLDKNQGRAYQDTLPAQVTTSLDCIQLSVSSASWGNPLIFEREQAQETAAGLVWKIDLPLQGSGSQTLLFAAQNEAGAQEKQTAEIFAEAEAPRFAQETAQLQEGESEALLSVKTTAAAKQLDILDASGAILQSCTAREAQIDRCLPGDETGRYALWTIPLPADTTAHALRLNGETLPVERMPAPEKEFVLYSQCDGYWQDKKYRHSTLEHSGCAIFALSHALQLLGFEGDEISPEQLAQTYAFCLLEGGTMNSTLVGHAGDDFGFKTRYELYHNLSDILSRMERGAVYSFGVVSGHIAMVAGVTEDHSKFRIIDSAPSATLERIKGGKIYYQNESGAFVPVSDLADFPGSVYYIETNAYGGLEYYLDASYVSKQGVRLILPEAK